MADIAATLMKLADGIIPPDDSDSGASAVQAGPRLAERIAQGVNAAVYRQGIDAAERLASERFHAAVSDLNADQVHELLGALRETQPGFFKQLRMDVSALYLSDPQVWQRIGFPGPSVETGGYPDFAEPQS
jgi:restriction endonuclease Mrr